MLYNLAVDFYRGQIGYAEFFISMEDAVTRYLTQAWHEGARIMGILPDEMSTTEREELDAQIANDHSFIGGLADAIAMLHTDQAPSGKTITQRLDYWSAAYVRVRERAKIIAGQDQKLEWVLGPAEHCPDCLRLAGKVKRASLWRKYNYSPKSHNLACRQNCKCELVVTDKPLSRGPLPKVGRIT